jgi:hypothetical protein
MTRVPPQYYVRLCVNDPHINARDNVNRTGSTGTAGIKRPKDGPQREWNK